MDYDISRFDYKIKITDVQIINTVYTVLYGNGRKLKTLQDILNFLCEKLEVEVID